MLYCTDHLGANPNKRDIYYGHLYFNDYAEFCKRWDQANFDPYYESKPVEFFADMERNRFLEQRMIAKLSG